MKNRLMALTKKDQELLDELKVICRKYDCSLEFEERDGMIALYTNIPYHKSYDLSLYPSGQVVARDMTMSKLEADQGNWYPAMGEEPTRYRTGAVLLWCFQPSTGNHAYLNCETDLILSEEEAQKFRGDV